MFEVFQRLISLLEWWLTFDSPPAIVITCVFIERGVQVSPRLMRSLIANERKRLCWLTRRCECIIGRYEVAKEHPLSPVVCLNFYLKEAIVTWRITGWKYERKSFRCTTPQIKDGSLSYTTLWWEQKTGLLFPRPVSWLLHGKDMLTPSNSKSSQRTFEVSQARLITHRVCR